MRILNLLASGMVVISFILIVWMFIYLVEHPQCNPCIMMYGNGSEEDTGLYGNCQYINDYMRSKMNISREETWTNPEVNISLY